MRWDGSLSSILVSLCSLRVGMVTDKPMTVSQGSTDVSNGHRYPRQLQFGCFSHFLLCSKRDGMWLFLWWREINGALWAGGNSERHFKQRCHLVTVRWPHYSTHTLSEADRRTVEGTKKLERHVRNSLVWNVHKFEHSKWLMRVCLHTNPNAIPLHPWTDKHGWSSVWSCRT